MTKIEFFSSYEAKKPQVLWHLASIIGRGGSMKRQMCHLAVKAAEIGFWLYLLRVTRKCIIMQKLSLIAAI